jgi:glycosyltransferase involved in cell wall biosynthesis
MTSSELSLFSVLVANYNNGRYLAQAVDSVLAQTYPCVEVVIVDDGSTDESVAILVARYGHLAHVRIQAYPHNEGCGAAKARCVALAQGTWAGFLDPDDVLLPDAVSKMVALHQANPTAVLVHSDLACCDEALRIVQPRSYQNHALVYPHQSHLTHGGVMPFASFVVDAYRRTGGIDPTMKRAVDQDLYYKLEEQGRVFCTDEILYLYRIHSGGISTGAGNYSRALYWKLRAMETAYLRRKQLPPSAVANITPRKLRAMRSLLYVHKAVDKWHQGELCKGGYWLYQSVMTSVFDTLILAKFKAFFHYSDLRKWYHKKRYAGN